MENNNVNALDPSGMNLNFKRISCILLPSRTPNHHRTLQVAPRWCSLVVCQVLGIRGGPTPRATRATARGVAAARELAGTVAVTVKYCSYSERRWPGAQSNSGSAAAGDYMSQVRMFPPRTYPFNPTTDARAAASTRSGLLRSDGHDTRQYCQWYAANSS